MHNAMSIFPAVKCFFKCKTWEVACRVVSFDLVQLKPALDTGLETEAVKAWWPGCAYVGNKCH